MRAMRDASDEGGPAELDGDGDAVSGGDADGVDCERLQCRERTHGPEISK